MNETEWDRYGTGVNPKCANCMMHCGYEMTAVDDTFSHPLKAAKVAFFGPKTSGPMAPEVPFRYPEPVPNAPRPVAIADTDADNSSSKRVA
jgi:hypothetical protein